MVLLVLGIAFYLPVAFAKAENSKQKETSDNQINVNVSASEDNNEQEDVNDNPSNTNDDQEDLNDDQGDDNDQEDIDDQNEDDQFNGEEHGSAMSLFVQNLLNVADKEHGQVGERIKIIAKEQDDNKDDVANEIDAIKHRNKIKTFFIGTDYENVGQLRSEMVKTSSQIDQLNKLLDQTTNVDSKIAIQAQIKVLEQEQQKIGDLLKTNESKFSLFGWFVKLFY